METLDQQVSERPAEVQDTEKPTLVQTLSCQEGYGEAGDAVGSLTWVLDPSLTGQFPS